MAIEYWKGEYQPIYGWVTGGAGWLLIGQSGVDWELDEMRLNCVFYTRETTDRKYKMLRSEINPSIHFYFEFEFTAFDIGFGFTVGYFDSKRDHLENSVFTCLVGNALGISCGNSKGELAPVVWSNPVIETDKRYKVRFEYFPREGIIPTTGITGSGQPFYGYGKAVLQIFDEENNLLDRKEFLADRFFLPDSFGVGNIDLHENVDNFFTYPYDPTLNNFVVRAYIHRLEYFDPTIGFPVQSVPALRSPIAPDSLFENQDYFVYYNALDFLGRYPDAYYAETTWADSKLLEGTYGEVAHFLVAHRCHTDSVYLAILTSLFRSGWGGPTLKSIERGIKALIGMPVLDYDGAITTLEQVGSNYHVIVSTDWGDREYTFPVSWGLGKYFDRTIGLNDSLPGGTPLSGGIEAVDYIKDPTWYQKIQHDDLTKYWTFGIKLDPLAISWNRLSAILTVFLYAIKPAGMHCYLIRDDYDPIFKLGEHTHLSYVNVSVLADWPAYIPADYAFLKGEDDVYYHCAVWEAIEQQEVPEFELSHPILVIAKKPHKTGEAVEEDSVMGAEEEDSVVGAVDGEVLPFQLEGAEPSSDLNYYSFTDYTLFTHEFFLGSAFIDGSLHIFSADPSIRHKGEGTHIWLASGTVNREKVTLGDDFLEIEKYKDPIYTVTRNDWAYPCGRVFAVNKSWADTQIDGGFFFIPGDSEFYYHLGRTVCLSIVRHVFPDIYPDDPPYRPISMDFNHGAFFYATEDGHILVGTTSSFFKVDAPLSDYPNPFKVIALSVLSSGPSYFSDHDFYCLIREVNGYKLLKISNLFVETNVWEEVFSINRPGYKILDVKIQDSYGVILGCYSVSSDDPGVLLLWAAKSPYTEWTCFNLGNRLSPPSDEHSLTEHPGFVALPDGRIFIVDSIRDSYNAEYFPMRIYSLEVQF